MNFKPALIAAALLAVATALAQEEPSTPDKPQIEKPKPVKPSQTLCPLCMAGGYAAGFDENSRWTFNTVIAPGSATDAESFLWYRPTPRLQVGLGYLWKQDAVRFLGSYQITPETEKLPSLNVSWGVQGVGTGNPGWAFTTEKTWISNGTPINAYTGVGFRTNESHAHLLFGVKTRLANEWTIGYQADGHQHQPFVVWSRGQFMAGAYLVDFKRPAWLVGVRF